MKKILGLDLGTNSIGWSLIRQDFEKKEGQIDGMGVRIIPMGQDELGKFDAGQSYSQTAERTGYRRMRRLYQRDNLRRERLHRVLKVLGFLPEYYAQSIDFERRLGQFKPGSEEKINYRRSANGKFEFVFLDSFHEMTAEFKRALPDLFHQKSNGEEAKIPYDWTIYFLRKKALGQKLTKEELAWVILNFNQKRGYYQLRGEELDEDKNQQFVQLKVKSVTDSGEKVKGNTLYDVVFENGWIYDRQVVKIEDWIGRTKEFIVTISTLKNGETSYSYKAVDSEKDWVAIKAKTEQDIDRSGKTVGEFIYESLLADPKQKIRGKLVKTIERKFYKEEFKKILSRQIELQPELFTADLYRMCIEELYPRNEAHLNSIKDKGFEYLFTEDIIFYQRPLKSQKSNIAGCPLEARVIWKKNGETGKKEAVKEPIPVISKSHPLFQEFRIWQWIQNLKIYNQAKIENGTLEEVTHLLLRDEADRVELFDYLNTRQSIESKQLIDYFVKKKLIDKSQKDNYRWNYVYDEEKKESKKYPLAETRVQFVNRLGKVEGMEDPETFLVEETATGNRLISREEQLWHIIYSVSDLVEYRKALAKFARRHQIDEASFVDNFLKFPPFESDFGSYSKKALEKLLPLMRMGSRWELGGIPEAVRQRAKDIMDRVDALRLEENYSEKELKEALSKVSDDDIPKQVVKSFVPFRGKDPIRGLNTYQVSYLIYERHSEAGDIQKWSSPEAIDRYLRGFKQHSLRNPIVEQVVTETLRVVRDIWTYYGNGEGGFFDEIHVELGREMKNPADKRKQISSRNSENETTNHRIKEVLKELMADPNIHGDVRSYSPSHQELLKLFEEGIYQNPQVKYDQVSEEEISKIRRNSNPSQKDIQRYRLWLEQGYISPYTGKTIPLSKLFTTEYEVEHIIPRSRYFDDSLTNKIICEKDVNENKDNKTAFEYLKEKGGSMIDGHRLLTLEQYIAHVNAYFKSNKPKLKNLLSEDIPEGFVNRQLNDSRYISTLVKGLLSNIVRAEGEREATSKNLIPVVGTITSKMKQDWGLNDKWNELVAPRFKRLNELTQSNKFGFWDKQINAFRIQVPDEYSKGFSAKRIDHRHHALDALVVACTTRNHTNYLNAMNAEKENFSLRDKLLIKNDQGDYLKTFQMPWKGFPVEAKSNLEQIIVSFKQNLRVINKSTNRFWSYKNEQGEWNLDAHGKPKKKLRKQVKGDSWAIRKKLHEETVSGKVRLYGVELKKGEFLTATRKALDKTFDLRKISKITDTGIQKILKNFLIQDQFKTLNSDGSIYYDSEKAFSPEGIQDLNQTISAYNKGKSHQPVHKVRVYEKGTGRFPLGEDFKKSEKYVQGAPNLFYAVYWNKERCKRDFETIPLNEVITFQKQVSHLPRNGRGEIRRNEKKGNLLFTLSPNELVYVPSEEEIETPGGINFRDLTKEQLDRIYNVNDFSGLTCYFSPNRLSSSICPKEVDMGYNEIKKKITGSFDTKTASFKNVPIKEVCVKLNIDRLGNITSYSSPNYPSVGSGSNTSQVKEPLAEHGPKRVIQISKSPEESENSQLNYWAVQHPAQRFGDFVDLMNRFYEFIKPDWKGKKIILDL